MDLYICEKPSQATDISNFLSVPTHTKAQGYYQRGLIVVTWVYGHLLEMAPPAAYDESFAGRWALEPLPVIPTHWKYEVKKAVLKQYKVIQGLVSQATTVYISTDFDREGETIARELLDRFRYSGKVRRVCLTSLDQTSIRRAMDAIKEEWETRALYHSGLARARADWLVGMNLSRLYTLKAQQAGLSETFHVGRVITPTIALVAARDESIDSFVPSPYYEVFADIHVQHGHMRCKWIPPEEVADEDGRCLNQAYAAQVAKMILSSLGTIVQCETKEGAESPPLPLDLSSLQQYAFSRWGYTAQEVLDAAQSLYETHKAISYPRSDSRYLPLSQLTDVPIVIQAIMNSDPAMVGLCGGVDLARKSRAFNDKKVTAHHAIIPTTQAVNIVVLSERERNVLNSVRLHYIAQFYAPFEFVHKHIIAEIAGQKFQVKGKTPMTQGWRVLFPELLMANPEDERDETALQLPKVIQGEPARVANAKQEDKMTRPSPHFTEATLLGAMENIARFVTEPEIKKILKETSGLGTVATRASIIEGALSKGYLIRKARTLRVTEKAKQLLSLVPEAVSSPGLTAHWEQQLEQIVQKAMTLTDFQEEMNTWISMLVGEGKLLEVAPLSIDKPDCQGPNCRTCNEGHLKRIKGRNGWFWGCQNTQCKKTYSDVRGKPQFEPKKPARTYKCFACSGDLRRINGRNGWFWACQNANCKMTFSDKQGRPVNRK